MIETFFVVLGKLLISSFEGLICKNLSHPTFPNKFMVVSFRKYRFSGSKKIHRKFTRAILVIFCGDVDWRQPEDMHHILCTLHMPSILEIF